MRGNTSDDVDPYVEDQAQTAVETGSRKEPKQYTNMALPAKHETWVVLKKRVKPARNQPSSKSAEIAHERKLRLPQK